MAFIGYVPKGFWTVRQDNLLRCWESSSVCTGRVGVNRYPRRLDFSSRPLPSVVSCLFTPRVQGVFCHRIETIGYRVILGPGKMGWVHVPVVLGFVWDVFIRIDHHTPAAPLTVVDALALRCFPGLIVGVVVNGGQVHSVGDDYYVLFKFGRIFEARVELQCRVRVHA